MELVNIENLLEAYFEGQTSIEDENVLKTFFAQEDVPVHLQEYKLMFDYFAQNKAEVSDQPIQVNTKTQTWKKNWLSIAAALVLLFTIYKVVPTTNNFTDKEIAEAQRAYVESQKAFKLISKSLNRGNGALAFAQDYEVTKNKIFKNN